MTPTSLLKMFSACLLFSSLQSLSAQQMAKVEATPFPNADSAASGSSAIVSSAPVPEPKPLTARWLDLKTVSHGERFRSSTNQGGGHLFEDGQERSLVEGKVKLDREGRYTINFRASSGRYFSWAYADYAGKGIVTRLTDPSIYSSYSPAQLQELGAASYADPQGLAVGLQVSSSGWEFYLRQLYVSVTPVKAVTVEFGSLGFERGLGTEITTFDEDGYLTGERIRFHAPKQLYVDEVGYTNAFFGDIAKPNLFTRGDSYEEFNYRQVFAKKQVTKRVGVSADYTWQLGTNTLRQAALVAARESRLVDSFRVETYERVNGVNLQGRQIPGGAGFAVMGERKLGSRVIGDVGFASIDTGYSAYAGHRVFSALGYSFNGDTYGIGNRPFVHASVKITPVVSAFGFYTHAVGERVPNFNQQGLNAGLNFDFKALANSGKKIF